MANCKWQVANCKLQMANGKWEMASCKLQMNKPLFSELQMESDKWRIARGKCRRRTEFAARGAIYMPCEDRAEIPESSIYCSFLSMYCPHFVSIIPIEGSPQNATDAGRNRREVPGP